MLIPRLVSPLILVAYLSAAFLPCEPTGGLLAARPARAAAPERAPVDSPLRAARGQRPESHLERRHAGHAARARPRLASPPRAEKTLASSHAAHDGDSSGADHAARPAAAAHQGADSACGGEFKSKCPCGCGDTRAAVGGGAARLGSVVPGACLSGLVAAPRVVPEDRWRGSSGEPHRALDPIPI